jgi:amino acid adenylation domain-containing protein
MTEHDNWFEAVSAVARRAGERVAVRDGDAELRYAELVQKAEALAAWLHERGIRPGDRVGVHLRKGIEEILVTLAAVRLGAVFVHMHPQLTVAQLTHVARDSGMRLLVTNTRRASELQTDPRLAELAMVVLEEGAEPPLVAWPRLDAPVSAPPPSPGRDELAALLYTSGSTGRPKGVMHSQGNLVAFAANVAEYLGASASDRVLGLLPISFGYGLNQVLTTLAVGGTLVLQKAPFPAEVVKTLVRERITGLAAVPSVWGQLLAYLDQEPTPLESIRYVTNAGGHLSEQNARRLQKHLPEAEIVLMYGSTEALRSTYLPPAEFASKVGSIGRAIPNVQVFVLDAEGKPCGVGEPGELVHHGAHVSQGYWNNPAETAQRFKPAPGLAQQIGGALVYHSGDLVKRDVDGVLWFVSRIGWMVKSGGFRFSLAEVEELVLESGTCAEAAAFTVDDEMLGQAVHVVISPKAGVPFDAAALERYCWKAMPSYMLPKAFHAWQGSFPLLANGKLDRAALSERLRPRATP